MRAATSDPPPGGYGTIILTGRVGFHCAWAGVSSMPSTIIAGHSILRMLVTCMTNTTMRKSADRLDRSITVRIWHQSMTELHGLGVYKASLERHASRILEAGQTVEVHGLPKGAYRGRSPTAALSNAFAHHRILDPVLDNAVRAERQGFDAFVLGSYSEPFLRELRSAIDIPVVSVTEATLLVACSIGRLAAPVSNDPAIARLARS